MVIRVWVWAGRLVLLVAFLMAAWHKILDPASFALAVFRYHLLPDAAVNPVAIMLPWVETVLAMALLAGRPYRRASLWSILLLLGLFTAAMGFNLWRGLDVACGCFSHDPSTLVGPATILRNGVGMVIVALLLWGETRVQMTNERYPPTAP